MNGQLTGVRAVEGVSRGRHGHWMMALCTRLLVDRGPLRVLAVKRYLKGSLPVKLS
jgi:hypothetical protein